MTDARALYHATIVDHDRNARNERPLSNATHAATLDNPLCGDTVTMRFVVENDTITDAAFEARGCALSRAAASIATTRAIGSSPSSLIGLATTLDRFVHAAPDAAVPEGLGELEAFSGVRGFKSRRTCACLAFRATATALESGAGERRG